MRIRRKVLSLVSMLGVTILFGGYAQAQMPRLRRGVESVKDKVKKSDTPKPEQKAPAANKPAAGTTPASAISPPDVAKSDEVTSAKVEIIKKANWSLDPILNVVDGTYSNGMYGHKRDNAVNFMEYCQKAAKKLKPAKEIINNEPQYSVKGTESASHVERILQFEEKFLKWSDEFLANEIVAGVDRATNHKQLQYVEAAEAVRTGVLALIPDHAKIAGLGEQISGVKAELGGSIYSSPFHAEHAGKIVFAKGPIAPKQETSASISPTFTGDDLIYAMVYLRGAYDDLAKGSELRVDVSVNGDRKAYREYPLSKERRQLSYLDMELVPDPKESERSGPLQYVPALAGLHKGKHTVKVEYMASGAGTLAVGEFELDLSGGHGKLKEIAKTLREKSLEKIRMAKPAKRDASLEKSMGAALKAADWKGTPLRTVITDADWTVHRNASGAIVYRTIGAETVVEDDDQVCKVFVLTYKQNYDGKSYGKTEYHSVGGNQEILKANITK